MRVLLLIGMMFTISCSSTKKEERSSEDKKADIYYTQGTSNLLRGEYHKALKNLRLSAKFRPKDSKTQNNLGMAYYYRKSHSNAIKHLKLALKYDPKNIDARQNLATVYTNVEKFDLALQHYNVVLKDLEYEGQAKTHYNLGLLFIKKRKTPKAIEHLKKSLEISEYYCPSSFKLGELYKKARRPQMALDYYKLAGKGPCYGYFGPFKEQIIILAQLGQFTEAKKVYQETQERFSDIKIQQELRKIKKYIAIKEKKASRI